MNNDEKLMIEGFYPDGTPVLPGTRLTDDAIRYIAPLLADLFAKALAPEADRKSGV